MGAVASLLAERSSLRLSCMDRLLVQGYQPRLQSEGLIVRWMLDRGDYPSPKVFGHLAENFVYAVGKYVRTQGLPPVIPFKHGDVKEDIARPFQLAAAAAGREGVVMVGVAKEKMLGGWRGSKCGGSAQNPHFNFSRAQVYVNHYYFYLWDAQWGPAFVKIAAYAPFPVWACMNGHEWLKRRLTDAGVGFDALDNGLRSCADPAAAQAWADRMSGPCILEFVHRWLDELPCPMTARDRALGYEYAWSFRQTEFSDTTVFERPRDGRAWFDAAIRDNLDIGHPSKVHVIFDRRITTRTPGRFSTKVVNVGVDPTIYLYYRASKVKAYFKDLHGVRVETTINNNADFGVKKTVNADNFEQLRDIGRGVNARFLEAFGADAAPPPDTATLDMVVMPSVHDGQRAPGFRFGEPRSQALLASIVAFDHVIEGITNRGLVTTMHSLYHPAYTSRQATYDLRRLKRKEFIERTPGHNTYRLTPTGRALATTITQLHQRVMLPAVSGLDALAPPGGHHRPIVQAWRRYEHELDRLIGDAHLTLTA